MEDLVDLTDHFRAKIKQCPIDWSKPKPDPAKIIFTTEKIKMALIKSIQTDYMVPAEYWHIGAVQEDFKGKGTEVTFYGYANQAARESGAQPMSSGKVQIAGEEYVAGADRAALYAIIKQKPEFEGAQDA